MDKANCKKTLAALMAAVLIIASIGITRDVSAGVVDFDVPNGTNVSGETAFEPITEPGYDNSESYIYDGETESDIISASLKS